MAGTKGIVDQVMDAVFGTVEPTPIRIRLTPSMLKKIAAGQSLVFKAGDQKVTLTKK